MRAVRTFMMVRDSRTTGENALGQVVVVGREDRCLVAGLCESLGCPVILADVGEGEPL